MDPQESLGSILVSNKGDKNHLIPRDASASILSTILEISDEAVDIASQSRSQEKLESTIDLPHLLEDKENLVYNLLLNHQSALSMRGHDIGKINTTRHHIGLHDSHCFTNGQEYFQLLSPAKLNTSAKAFKTCVS